MNGALAALILFAFPAPARAAVSTRTLLERMERTAERMDGAHPLQRRAAAKELDAYRAAFVERGVVGTRALAHYLASKERPLTVRVHAASFLGSIASPEGFPALRAAALDETEDPGLRSTAVLSLGALRVPPRTVRPVFESLLAESTPGIVRREALGQLARVGARSIGVVLDAAKRFGPSPEGLAAIAAGHAVAAVEKAPVPEARDALFRLLRLQRRDSPLRAEILTALSRRKDASRLPRRDRETLEELLFQPDESLALQAARLLGRARDPRAIEALARALRTRDSTLLLAEIADALAAIGDPRGRDALARLRAELPDDPRFANDPRAGERAARIEAAAAVFESTPAARAAETAGRAAALAFSYEGWPGEGRPVVVWTGPGDALALKREPARDAPDAAPLKIAAETEIAFTDSVVITREPGLARTSAATTLRGDDYGRTERVGQAAARSPKPVAEISLAEGDPLELLSYRAEGLCFVRLPANARVLEAACPENSENFKILDEPKVDWWLRAVGPGGVSGWFLSDAPGLEFRSRRF